MPVEFVVPAGEIRDGEAFRKLAGTFVYLKVSESAAKAHEFKDRDTHVYGVTHNGNMAKVEKTKKVFRKTNRDMIVGCCEEDRFNRAVNADFTAEILAELTNVFPDLDVDNAREAIRIALRR